MNVNKILFSISRNLTNLGSSCNRTTL